MTATLTTLKAYLPTGKTLTKAEGGWIKSVAGDVKHFEVSSHQVDSLESLTHVLVEASKQPKLVVIMDDLKEGVAPTHVLRRSVNFNRGIKPFIFLDLDKLSFAETDLLKAGARARALLPPDFHDAACSIQATSQHMIATLDDTGIPTTPTSRLRLYFWLDAPINHAQAKQWAKRSSIKIDQSLFDSVHVTYVANPTFVGGPDPFPTRWAMLEGSPSVHVPPDLDAVAPPIQDRLGSAPDGVEENAERAVADFIALVDREFNAKVATGRRNLFRNWANDAFDRAISPDLVDSLFHGLISGGDDEAINELESEMRALKVRDASHHAERVRRVAVRTADRWQEGDSIDLSGEILRGIDDAPGFRQTPVGSWYRTAADTEAFGTPDASNLADQFSDEDRTVPAHLAEARALGEAAKQRAKKKRDRSKEPLTCLDFDAAVASALDDSAEPLIDGVLYRGTMAILYGASSSGKTFVALDIVEAIAAMPDWRGRSIANGLAVYVAAEAGPTIKPRLAALAKRNPSLDRRRFKLITNAIDLRDPAEIDMNKLRSTLQEQERQTGEKVALIVLDTFSRVMAGGDENSSVDMGRMVQVIDALKEEFGATVLVVHHSGKDAAKGARGHSLLRAATDTEIEVTSEQREENGKAVHYGVMTVTKDRNGPLGGKFQFKLDGSLIGHTARGAAVTAATVHWFDAAETAEKLKPSVDPAKLPFGQRAIYEALREALKASGDTSAPTSDVVSLSGGKARQTVNSTLGKLVDLMLVFSASPGRWGVVSNEPAGRSDPTEDFAAPTGE